MGRMENQEIFRDTSRLAKNNPQLSASVRNSAAKQLYIPETGALEDYLPDLTKNKNRYKDKAEVILSGKRTLEAAESYKDMKTCVLNFASATTPGGGVVNGSSAQEECLCRCSTLYFCLNTPDMWGAYYTPNRVNVNPIHMDDCIYTPEITVFKKDIENPYVLSSDAWYNVNVISCAAPNLREKPANNMNPGDGDKPVEVTKEELQSIHEKRLRRILDIAVADGNEAIILGAFGCGAFANSPTVVAEAAKNVIADYLNSFKVIEFAVYCTPRDMENYKVFMKTLKEYTK